MEFNKNEIRRGENEIEMLFTTFPIAFSSVRDYILIFNCHVLFYNLDLRFYRNWELFVFKCLKMNKH